MDEHRWKAGGGAYKAAALALLLAFATAAHGQSGGGAGSPADRSSVRQIDRWSSYIDEASARFSIPESWIRRVMRAESGGRTMLDGRPITSRAGAMGLMQLMPGTWAEMRARHGFGPDPHQPRDNILAGAAYLRAMYDRFGYPGLFAAYHAGPARYARHLSSGRQLPPETVAYVAAVGSDPWRAQANLRQMPRQAGIFVSLATFRPRDTGAMPMPPASGTLFVRLSLAPTAGE